MKTGEGQLVDISLAEVGLPWFTGNNAHILQMARFRKTLSTSSISSVSGFYRYSYMMVGCANQKTWENFATNVLQKPEWINEAHYLTNELRNKNVNELEKDIELITTTKPTTYWINLCDEYKVPADGLRISSKL